jgi:hypothetical protein
VEFSRGGLVGNNNVRGADVSKAERARDGVFSSLGGLLVPVICSFNGQLDTAHRWTQWKMEDGRQQGSGDVVCTSNRRPRRGGSEDHGYVKRGFTFPVSFTSCPMSVVDAAKKGIFSEKVMSMYNEKAPPNGFDPTAGTAPLGERGLSSPSRTKSSDVFEPVVVAGGVL